MLNLISSSSTIAFKCLTLASHTELLISVNESGGVLHTVREREKSYTDDQTDPNVVQPFAAYSPPGIAKVSSCCCQFKVYLEL